VRRRGRYVAYTIIYGAINKYKGKDIIKLSEN